jgi:hypothetical protein
MYTQLVWRLKRKFLQQAFTQLLPALTNTSYRDLQLPKQPHWGPQTMSNFIYTSYVHFTVTRR